MVECVVTALSDEYPRFLRKYKELFILGISVLCFLIGLSNVTRVRHCCLHTHCSSLMCHGNRISSLLYLIFAAFDIQCPSLTLFWLGLFVIPFRHWYRQRVISFVLLDVSKDHSGPLSLVCDRALPLDYSFFNSVELTQLNSWLSQDGIALHGSSWPLP